MANLESATYHHWLNQPSILFFCLSVLLIFRNVGAVSIWTILIWIAIPSFFSLIFYIRKYRSVKNQLKKS